MAGLEDIMTMEEKQKLDSLIEQYNAASQKVLSIIPHDNNPSEELLHEDYTEVENYIAEMRNILDEVRIFSISLITRHLIDYLKNSITPVPDSVLDLCWYYIKGPHTSPNLPNKINQTFHMLRTEVFEK